MDANITPRAPFPTDPEEFGHDVRISLDKVTFKYQLEDERHEQWEWNEAISKWVPVVDEEDIRRQQEIYKVEGVDENEPAMETAKKRKAQGGHGQDTNGKAKKARAEPGGPPSNTAIYVTSLPPDVEFDEVVQVFKRFGILAENFETNIPRIKLYKNEDGTFKGDALIVYNRPESVDMAIEFLDGTDFRLGQKLPTGPMRITEADASYKVQKEQPLASESAKKKGTNANKDRQKIIKKNEEMKRRLADWSDDDDDPSTMREVSGRWDKVIVLKHMFKPEDLVADPAELLNIKEDVRDECEKLGKVTNIILYDKEEEGIITVRFDNPTSAQAAIRLFDGRMFDGRKVESSLATGKERWKRSKKVEEDDDAAEEARIEKYSQWLEGK